MSVVNDITRDEAMTLVRLGAVAARAEGVHVQKKEGDEDSIEIIGLFESSRPSDRLRHSSVNRISVPPPPVAPSLPTPTPRPAHRSLPPVMEIYEPRNERVQLVPIANMAIAWCGQRSPGYQQGILVMTVDAQPSRGRHLVVQLVVLDAEGHLCALDPPVELVEAAAAMSGEARWRKLTARITPKPDGGATLHVDVI